jgi:segregation and condensation protein A
MPAAATARGDRDGRAILSGAFPLPGSAPTVLFEDGRNESSTHIRWEEFEGPLALLLALIEARQLDVLTVPLGGLAEAYLDALATLPGDRLGNVSGFVAVASQLILIKSQAILPRPPKVSAVPLDGEPDPEAELRARLLEYRRFRDAGLVLGEQQGVTRLYRRDPDVAATAGRAGARPPERPPLPPAALPAALRRLARVVPDVPVPQEVLLRTVTMAERTAVIRAALRGADVVVLQELMGAVHDRVVVAITFLAMLELCKRREITLEQAEPWGPIIARKRIVTVEPDSAADDDELDPDDYTEPDE